MRNKRYKKRSISYKRYRSVFNRSVTVLCLCVLLSGLSACNKAADSRALREGKTIITSESNGIRDNTPVVLIPSYGGDDILGNEKISINISNASEGYIVVNYKGDAVRAKMQLTGNGQVTYTYDLYQDEFEVIPLTADSGTYVLTIYENIDANQYATIFSSDFDVTITNTFGPFLYPNMFVYFNKTSKVVAMAETLAKNAPSDLEVVARVYQYVMDNVSYDHEKAETVESGYIPDVDEIMEIRKGICFDYAAMMAAMLRSQRIPARLEIGYAGDAYHAWLSVYTPDTGWLEGVIVFDGKTWSLVDPTFADNAENAADFGDFIGSGDNYFT
ncbi:MAG: transglutaminase-like domain-containing protein, partial [Lachnospiraceae bacterium]|nr:transglutaminase-like domain-containing protein [Lachnospiraceae bacterium]